MVCALEQYADSQGVNWQGQRSDYLAIGWYNSVCYVVVIELRDVLSTEKQMEKKFEQVRHSMEQVISRLPEIEASNVFAEVCYQPEEYKFIGVVIPSNHSKKRTEQTRKVSLSNGSDGFIFTLPNSRIKNCRINWSEMLAELHSYIMS